MRDTMVLGHVCLWLVMPAVDTVGFTDGDLLGVGLHLQFAPALVLSKTQKAMKVSV